MTALVAALYSELYMPILKLAKWEKTMYFQCNLGPFFPLKTLGLKLPILVKTRKNGQKIGQFSDLLAFFYFGSCCKGKTSNSEHSAATKVEMIYWWAVSILLDVISRKSEEARNTWPPFFWATNFLGNKFSGLVVLEGNFYYNGDSPRYRHRLMMII